MMDGQKNVTTDNGEAADKPKTMNPLHNSGHTLHGWRVNNTPMRAVEAQLEHIKDLVDIEVRDADVLLATFMKSGECDHFYL